MHKLLKLAFFAIVSFFIFSTVYSQDYRINNYGIGEGISHPFVYTINQDNKGYIWIGTGDGLCRFNGFAFSTDIIQDTLVGQVAGVSFKDSRGILWVGYHGGNIAKYDGNEFELIQTGTEINSAITGFTEIPDGEILASTLNNGVLSISTSTGKAKIIEGIAQNIYTAILAKGNALLLGAQEGLAVYSIDNTGTKAAEQIKIQELEFIRIQDIQPSSVLNAFWIATEDQGVFRLALNGQNYSILKIGTEFSLDKENIQAVFEDSDKQLWLGSLRNGVFRLSEPDGKGRYKMLESFNKQNGLPGNAIKRIFEDLDGNIWIATYGDEISLLTGHQMVFTELEST
jgi:ligand-binding sensor domain-containing protein